jgi:hypothetical protein
VVDKYYNRFYFYGSMVFSAAILGFLLGYMQHAHLLASNKFVDNFAIYFFVIALLLLHRKYKNKLDPAPHNRMTKKEILRLFLEFNAISILCLFTLFMFNLF